jgi:hypothetical protein
VWLCRYLYDVADVDDDAAVDGLRPDPLAVLEDLETPDTVLRPLFSSSVAGRSSAAPP